MPTTITGTTIVTTTITGSIARLTGGTQEFVTPTSGTAAYLGARAWVNFNGTGTAAIRGSSNVSSITNNGVGDYTINFTTNLTDGNYSAAIGSVTKASDNGLTFCNIASNTDATSTALRIRTNDTTAFEDRSIVNVVIFR